MVNRIVLHLLLLSLAGWSCGCSHRLKYSSTASSQHEEEIVLSVLGIISACPSWWDISKKGAESEEVTALQEHLKELAKYDTTLLRKAIGLYHKQQLEKRSFNAREKARLCVINRYLFAVPDLPQPDTPPNVGWRIVDYETVSLLWPLSNVDKDGNIKLGLPNVVYTGQYYSPLDEFDYFNSQFGRR